MPVCHVEVLVSSPNLARVDSKELFRLILFDGASRRNDSFHGGLRTLNSGTTRAVLLLSLKVHSDSNFRCPRNSERHGSNPCR